MIFIWICLLFGYCHGDACDEYFSCRNGGSLFNISNGSDSNCQCACAYGFEGPCCQFETEELAVSLRIEANVTTREITEVWSSIRHTIVARVNRACVQNNNGCCHGGESSFARGTELITDDSVIMAFGFPVSEIREEQRVTTMAFYVTASQDPELCPLYIESQPLVNRSITQQVVYSALQEWVANSMRGEFSDTSGQFLGLFPTSFNASVNYTQEELICQAFETTEMPLETTALTTSRDLHTTSLDSQTTTVLIQETTAHERPKRNKHNHEKEKNGLSSREVSGVVVAVFLLILIGSAVGISAFYYIRKKRKPLDKSSDYKQDQVSIEQEAPEAIYENDSWNRMDKIEYVRPADTSQCYYNEMFTDEFARERSVSENEQVIKTNNQDSDK